MSLASVVPKRMFGNTGVSLSKLCLGGGSFMNGGAPRLLEEALRCGIDCWEIVSFTGKAYAEYFNEHPGIRESVFLSGKVYSANPDVMQNQLDKTLEENGVSMIDFLAVHGVDSIAMLTNDVRRWAEKAKREKEIRFFGFCTHRNMAECLAGAADLGWIDGVQTVYNYRLQQQSEMNDALRKCHENGLGIFAVKSMGLGVRRESALWNLLHDRDEMAARLARHAISFEQAKLKASMQNPHLTSICSLMPTTAIMRANAEAAMDELPLDTEILGLLHDFAEQTGRYFCTRCGHCSAATLDKIPIFNLMEMLMYARGYGMKDFAAKMFAQLPAEIRGKMEMADYSKAEELCPQNMPIAELMKEAVAEFAN